MSALTRDDWRAAYRQWVYAQDLVNAVRQRLLSGNGEGAASEAASSLSFLEEQVEIKRTAMDQCLQAILARRSGGAISPLPAGPLVRLSLTVEEPVPGQHRWVALGLFADGTVQPVDRSSRSFASREEAHSAGMASMPPSDGAEA